MTAEGKPSHIIDADTVQAAELEIGTVVGGKFRVTGYLGSGGFGTVYKAQHLEMGNDVALKVLHPRFASDPDAVKRLQREARIISRLRHKNILTVYALGLDEGKVYMAMEFVHGRSLAEMLREKGKLTPDDALPLLSEVCDAMAYAHNNDTLHRDLKPDNILIDEEDDGTRCAKVVDFGLARLFSNETQRLTKTGEIVGDPRYMSPEQAQGKQLDARSDIYSFGCLMYHALSGEPPFSADTPVGVLMKQVNEEPAPFAQRQKLPAGLESITLTALAKDVESRFQSFGDLRDALNDFVGNPNFKFNKPKRSKRRQPFLASQIFVGAVAVFMVLVAVALLLMHKAKEDRESRELTISSMQAQLDQRQHAYLFNRQGEKDINQMLQLAERIKAYDILAQIKCVQASELMQHERYTEAQKILETMPALSLVSSQTAFRGRFLLSRTYFHTRDFARAEPLIAAVIEDYDTHVPRTRLMYNSRTMFPLLVTKNILLRELAVARIRLGKYDEAENTLARVDRYDQIGTDRMRVEITLFRDGFDKAEAELKRLIADAEKLKDPSLLRGRKGLLIELYSRVGDRQALPLAMECIKIPRSSRSNDWLSRDHTKENAVALSFDQRKCKDTERLAEQLINEYDGKYSAFQAYPIYVYLAYAKRDLNKKSDSEVILKKVIREADIELKNPTSDFHQALAREALKAAATPLLVLYYSDKRLEEAEKVLDLIDFSWKFRNGHLNDAYIAKMNLLAAQKKWAQLESVTQELMRAAPNAESKASALYGFLGVYLTAQRNDLAQQAYKDLQELDKATTGTTHNTVNVIARLAEISMAYHTHDNESAVRDGKALVDDLLADPKTAADVVAYSHLYRCALKALHRDAEADAVFEAAYKHDLKYRKTHIRPW